MVGATGFEPGFPRYFLIESIEKTLLNLICKLFLIEFNRKNREYGTSMERQWNVN